MKYENLFKIYIPEPCHEDWDKMTPSEHGAFCKSCAKTVIDFSDKTPEEVYVFLEENFDKKMCGRFKISQIEETPKLKNEIQNIPLPEYLFGISNSPFKAYVMALIVVASISIGGCGNSDGSATGDKDQKIESTTTGAYEIKPDTNDINKNESDTSSTSVNPDERLMGGVSVEQAKKMGLGIDPSKEVMLLGKPVMKKDTTITTDTVQVNYNNHIKMGIMVKTKDTKEK